MHLKGNEQYLSTPDAMNATLWATNRATVDLSRANVVEGNVAPPPWASNGSGEMCAAERDRLLTDHLPSVRYVARKIHERLPQHVELEDLVSAGIVGLIDAFNKFDHSKKVQFKSYAQFRIRGAILDSLRVMDWGPRELRRKGRAVQDAIQALTRMLHRAPAEQEIADEMGMGLAEYQLLLGDLKGLEIGSLNLDHSEDSDEEELAYVAGPAEESPLFLCLQGETRQRLLEAVEELPEKERMVLTLYYYEELTMKEIGLALGVVESRVSQIHSAALRRLRISLRERGKGAVDNHGKRQAHQTLETSHRRASAELPC
ncbi:MAG: FliA/WhiG family RNA polymerase sigma factor [Acidobacteria bacterium]|nr:FliA/WhiG family RNA polymerase sigma factor [Acidobacteriota bacterium]